MMDWYDVIVDLGEGKQHYMDNGRNAVQYAKESCQEVRPFIWTT